MKPRHVRTAALAAACAGLALPAGAFAHVGVKSYSPAPGSTIGRYLRVVRITFKARIADGKLEVERADGTTVSRGDGRVVREHTRVRVRLRDGLRAGRYTATARVLNTDGHVATKSWSFSLR